MSDNSFGPDLSFLNEKVQPDRRADIPGSICLDE
jgi:hypothetical protein